MILLKKKTSSKSVSKLKCTQSINILKVLPSFLTYNSMTAAHQ